jgi:hypothetical protein
LALLVVQQASCFGGDILNPAPRSADISSCAKDQPWIRQPNTPYSTSAWIGVTAFIATFKKYMEEHHGSSDIAIDRIMDDTA